MPPPERTPLIGIFSGEPMLSPFPLPLGGLPDRSSGSGNGDLFSFLAGLASGNSTAARAAAANCRQHAGANVEPENCRPTAGFRCKRSGCAARAIRRSGFLRRSPRQACCFGGHRPSESDAARVTAAGRQPARVLPRRRGATLVRSKATLNADRPSGWRRQRELLARRPF
jgi:hypothetical protein